MKKDKAKAKKKVTTKKATTKKVAKKAVTKKKPVSNKKSKENRDKVNKEGNKRGLNKASQANLTPGGPGRPKGKLNFDTRIDLAIEALAAQMVEHHNKQPKNKKKQITLEDIDVEGDIFMQLLNKARGGNEKMIIDFLDRRHGKAVARVELTGKDGDPIAYEERKKEAKSRAREMLDKWTKKK